MRVRIIIAAVATTAVVAVFAACGGKTEPPAPAPVPEPTIVANTVAQPEPTPTPASKFPNLQAMILEQGRKTSDSPIGKFDFKNFEYPLPRGWQDSDGKEAVLVNGKRPVTMTEELQRTGLSHVTTNFFDVTGDDADEAIVILKIETGGSAIPQLVYVFQWKSNAPELIWYFRTGDRADGGLRNIRAESGELIIELYGQDRYVVGELDTAKITGDEEQLCCPTHWTASRYKWNGNNFRLQGKRLTYLTSDPTVPPIENMVEAVEKQNGGKK